MLSTTIYTAEAQLKMVEEQSSQHLEVDDNMVVDR